MNSHWIARAVAALAVLAVTAVASPAFAADKYYLEIHPTGAVGPQPKAVADTMLTVTGFSFGVGKPPGSATGGAGAGKAADSSLTVTGIDNTTAQSLFADATSGKHLAWVRLIITKADAQGKQKPYEIYTFSEVYVTSASMNGGVFTISGGSKGPSDTFDFNYAKLSMKHEKNTAVGTTTPSSWSKVTNDSWTSVP
jgi:type VI protein secretion system component Hcp